jgi:hypothetical protein
MNAPRSTRRSQASTVGLALVAVVVVAASVALLRINSVTAAPPVASPSSAPVTPAPTVTPGDDVADLGVSGAAGAYVLTVVQPGPYPYTDAMGEDRVLILTFDAPVSADDVAVEILDRTVD